MSDYEYLCTVEKLDDLFEKKEKNQNLDLSLLKEDIKVKNIDKSMEIKKNKFVDKKKDYNSRENDLFEEIYGKYSGDYAELVEAYVQILIKFENKRIKKAYFFGLLFCIVSISLAALFSSIIMI